MAIAAATVLPMPPSRPAQVPSPTLEQMSPLSSTLPEPALNDEGEGILDTLILGVTSGVERLLGRGQERCTVLLRRRSCVRAAFGIHALIMISNSDLCLRGR